jgi:hypothetical protein
MQVSDVSIRNPSINATNGPYDARGVVHYRAGRLLVSHDGDYQVTITTMLGRSIYVFSGKGATEFALGPKTGAGMYCAVIRAKNGAATRRFMVD